MTLLTDAPAVYRPALGVLSVRGADRLTYLNSLLSQRLDDTAPGTVADFMYLDAKGTAQAVGRAVTRDDDVVLLVPRTVAATFAAALQRFTFLLEASTADLTDGWSVASLRGPDAVDVGRAPPDPMTAVGVGEGVLVRDRHGGVDVAGPTGWVSDVLADLQLPAATDEQWEAWRISAGVPGWDTEIIPGRRAQELGLLPTHVHLRKGCYPGQESIAKIYNLGRPRRSLCVAEFDGPVGPGDAVSVAGKAGEITSAAPHGSVWVAMALLPVDANGDVLGDGTVVVDDVQGRVRFRVGAEMAIPGA